MSRSDNCDYNDGKWHGWNGGAVAVLAWLISGEDWP